MKIKCPCGETVIEGEVENIRTGKGKRKKIFQKKEGEIIGHRRFGMYKILVREQINMNGEIHRNNSSDPDKWTGLCSKCQANPKSSSVPSVS